MSKIDCTLDDVVAALGYFHVDDREEWVTAAMAIKSEFGEGGFSTWDDWSSSYKGYKAKEALSVWKSIKGIGVTIGTLFGLAQQRGFEFARREQTPQQKADFARECEARRVAREAEALREEADAQRWYSVVADTASQLLAHLKPTGTSAYLGVKKVGAYGIFFAPHSFVIRTNNNFTIDVFNGVAETRTFFSEQKNKDKSQAEKDSFHFFKRGSILVPLRDMQGALHNLQIIFNDGKSKRFFTNGRKSGLFHIIGDITPGAPIIFCEGYATGGSLHKATGWPVVVCFDAGNMPVVAEQFRTHENPKICAGDNDWETALDPKKKNTGLVKAQAAAISCDGTWRVPDFSALSDAAGMSDFNDLHVASGLNAVKQQLDDALARPKSCSILATGNSAFIKPDFDDRRFLASFDEDSPPDFSNVPLPDENDVPASDDDAPGPTLTAEGASLEVLLTRYALTDPDAKVWDSFQKRIIKSGAFKNIVKPKVYLEWLNHEKRRTVLLDDVEWQAAAAQKKGRGGLAEALNRYVYLNPSDTAWDKQEREIVALSHLKYAIADCFPMWVAHPDREEIPHKFLVFDPTQQCDTKTHINQFRGLSAQPVQNDARCRRIVEMLMALCNNDATVFRWLRRWLAYPLINVGAKMETSVLCHSDVHGSGKSYFFDVVMRAIYGEYSRTVGQAQLEGQYNDWMSKVLYCIYEEVLSRSQRYSHTGTIKQTITGKTVRIEKKFMSGWEEANHMNSVFLSNEVLPLPVEPSDRRFLVIWPETKLYEHLQRGVDEDLKNGGAGAFYYFLLQTKMQDTDEEFAFDEHTKPPMTEAKERLIEHGRAIWEVFYNEWERGGLLHNKKVVPYCSIRVSDLFKFFEAWCSKNKEHGMGAHKFASFIGSKIKKRRDLDYDFLHVKGKATFFIVGRCPDDKTQQQWLGACAYGHEEILDAGDFSSNKEEKAA